MSYGSIYACANDAALYGRITACCAQEGAENPQGVANDVLWPVVTATDIAAAYEAALISGNPDPGGDPSVITDQMILSNVQANASGPRQ
jgi:hypothetical protein